MLLDLEPDMISQSITTLPQTRLYLLTRTLVVRTRDGIVSLFDLLEG